MMMQMGQQGTPAVDAHQQLKQDFNVKHIEMDADKIDDDVKVLVVIHPKDISDKAQYAIDQFVLRGGKLIAFLDAQSAVASRQQNPMLGGMPGSVVVARQIAEGLGRSVRHRQSRRRFEFQDAIARPQRPAEGRASVAGAHSRWHQPRRHRRPARLTTSGCRCAARSPATPAAGLKETVLLNSTKDRELVDGFMASMGGEA